MRFPEITFVLFHTGYPWHAITAGLAHNHDNVFIDMVWAPIISTSASVDALRQYIEIAQSSDLIGWGADTWTSEEAVGAALAWKFVVTKVLAEMVDTRYISIKKAETLAHKLMYKNNAKIYSFEV
jgi:predicted TIM-barrel fold metal-dependent hydrolase